MPRLLDEVLLRRPDTEVVMVLCSKPLDLPFRSNGESLSLLGSRPSTRFALSSVEVGVPGGNEPGMMPTGVAGCDDRGPPPGVGVCLPFSSSSSIGEGVAGGEGIFVPFVREKSRVGRVRGANWLFRLALETIIEAGCDFVGPPATGASLDGWLLILSPGQAVQRREDKLESDSEERLTKERRRVVACSGRIPEPQDRAENRS